ncbi:MULTISPECIES: hypothetical protein [Nocardia]|uniref:hypothetical protein n=1 Tax=Nocardia TaxID=1817 RepID=UPI0007EC01E9|nr:MULTISPECIES: hypothetical protein [Nocardia]MBF6272169.1 hypothetical protein [Nocardia nova]OBA50880.1 hypothetical protein A5789_28240 [Nocardia sp. 852002-51101_SCH5132738]OBB50787.1 hypothetical protein A5748_17805 [Nocardia sp. 852002-51244_SCH5132740]OBF76066.1 hypothetical protein A9X06_25200 [Mycobacterium sp. 852002-51759_SCH5129042]
MNTTTKTTTVSTRRDAAEDIFTAFFAVVGWVVIAVFVLAWWALLFPMVSLPIAATAGLFWLYGWLPATATASASVGVLVLWWARYRESFHRWITRRARARFLAWFRYRRQWSALVDDCGLSVRNDLDQAVRTPRLLGIGIGETTDTVRVQMLSGQCPDDWANRAVTLAHAFRAQECRVSVTGPARVQLVFRHGDSLAEPVSALFPHIPGGLGGPPRQEDDNAA